MTSPRPELLLLELPTYPKGTVALSVYAVAASLKEHFDVRLLDVNLYDAEDFLDNIRSALGSPAVAGLKVSSQNFPFAKRLSARIREVSPRTRILWGGEFPTLLKDECLAHCDTVVTGQFETVARQLTEDFMNGGMKPLYHGRTPDSLEFDWLPDFGSNGKLNDYFSFMGLPLETSRGCTEKCVFCMVHVMQKNYVFKSQGQIEKELQAYRGRFVNVVDYNIGIFPEHVIKVAHAMKKAGVSGWMCEMCLESLDNDEMLQAMSGSGCRMVYCGLESIYEEALRSVNKFTTNHIENYERLIRKVQSYGIQVANGLILGLKGMNMKAFEESYAFFHRMGVVYTKLTFLTYNPGTKVYSSMERVGDYTTREYQYFDGNHLTYLPHGVSHDEVLKGTVWYIRRFYSLRGIVTRSFNSRMSFWRRMEYILFSYCYGEAYRQWLSKRVLYDEAGFTRLLMRPITKGFKIRIAEKLLDAIRRRSILP